MSVLKKRTLILTVGGSFFIAASLGMIWSIFPMFGNTLPHLIKESYGVPFKLSALMVSLVTGVLGVLAMFVISFFPLTFATEKK